MADPIENKTFLTEKLDENRHKMAVQVNKLKEDYNITRSFRMSVQENPWAWLLGAVLTGFLISRLPPREKEVYRWAELNQRVHPQKIKAVGSDKPDTEMGAKFWSTIKPAISTYIGREIYKRARRPTEHASH
jgi:hypothetical protein